MPENSDRPGTQIKLEEPKWLSGWSHTSVFNGGLLGSHFGSPGDPDTCLSGRAYPYTFSMGVPPGFMAPLWSQNESHKVPY